MLAVGSTHLALFASWHPLPFSELEHVLLLLPSARRQLSKNIATYQKNEAKAGPDLRYFGPHPDHPEVYIEILL